MSFLPGEEGDATQLSAILTLKEGLPHPDLSVVLGPGEPDGITLEERGEDRCLHIPGDLSSERASAIEESVWERMHFASHLRTERLGLFKVGDEQHRSESLAIVQLLVLYHLVTAKAAVAVGGDDANARKLKQPTLSFPAVGSQKS